MPILPLKIFFFEKQEITSKYHIDFEEFHSVYHNINEELWEKIRDGIIGKEYLREHRFYDSFKHFGVDNKELALYFEENFLDNIVSHNRIGRRCRRCFGISES